MHVICYQYKEYKSLSCSDSLQCVSVGTTYQSRLFSFQKLPKLDRFSTSGFTQKCFNSLTRKGVDFLRWGTHSTMCTTSVVVKDIAGGVYRP